MLLGSGALSSSAWLRRQAAGPKLYWNTFNNVTFDPGDAYAWMVKLTIGDNARVYSLLSTA